MMQSLKLLFVLLLSSASVRAFWWSTSQTSDPPVASKQVQYVRAFTYQPVAFPAHSLLAPPSPYKFIQASPASLIPTAKQITPVQSASQPVQSVQQPQQQSSSSPFSSFFGNAFGGGSGSSSVAGHPNSVSLGGSVPTFQQQQQQQHQQHQQHLQQVQQQQQQQQQQHQQHQQQQQVVHTPSSPPVTPPPSEVPSVNQGVVPPSAGFYGQQHPSKYPYFTMDQVQYLSSLPSNAPHTPQVQFVPCMCPIAVNVQSHGEVADKRLDETATTDAEVVVPSGESEK